MIDARASMALYRIVEQEWENQVKQKYSKVKDQVQADLAKITSFFGQKEEPKKKKKKQKLE